MTREGIVALLRRVSGSWPIAAQWDMAAVASVWLDELADFTDTEASVGLTRLMHDPDRRGKGYPPSVEDVIAYAMPLQIRRRRWQAARAGLTRLEQLHADALTEADDE